MIAQLELTGLERNWIRDAQNGAFVRKLQDFLQGNLSSEAIAFAEKAVEIKLHHPEFDLDIEHSFNSPYNVDLDAVTPSKTNPEPEKEKFMYIYNKLNNSSFFKDVITDIFDNSDRMNIKFLIEDKLGPNGNTTYSIVRGSKELKDNMVTVKIDKEYLEEQPLITVAKTFIHETVHVQMALLMTKNESGNFPGTINDKEIETLYEDYFQNDNEEHNFIANKYLPTIKNAIEELVPVFETPAKVSYISSLNLYDGTTLLEQWNWDHFYAIISLHGLTSTNYFNNFINISSNGINAELFEVYTQHFLIRDSEPSIIQFTKNID